jgi:hypothetical protein
MRTKSRPARIAASVVAALALTTLSLLAAFHGGSYGSREGAAKPTVAPTAFAGPISASLKHDWANAYGELPLAFEANQGQTDSAVRFLSRGEGYQLFLTKQEAVLTLRQSKPANTPVLKRAAGFKTRHSTRETKKVSVLRMRLKGANPTPAIKGVERMPSKANYFIGNDPQKWHTDVPLYARVKYQGIYPGIDLIFYGNQRRLEYDFVVAPGANPEPIALDVAGARKLEINSKGNVVMTVLGGAVELQKPVVYQEVKGERREIAANFVVASNHQIRFAVSGYDRTQPLTIDPVLTYSTYLGGTGADEAFGIALDAAGNAYVAGQTFSTDFPPLNEESATPPPDTATHGTAFVSELNPAGTALVYSTFLGGSGNAKFGDYATAIAVDTASPANIYVTGYTGSPDFPVSAVPLIGQPGPTGTSTEVSAFVTKLIPGNTGSAQLGYSSYLGGDTFDVGFGIAADASGNAYVVGVTKSTNFPTTANAISTALLNPTGSAFLSEIDTNATTGAASKVYSTYFGGTNGPGSVFLYGDAAFGIKIDSTPNAYIVGTTLSTDFPSTVTINNACNAKGSAFVTVINLATPPTTPNFSTCLGGSDANLSQGLGIALDSNNLVYLTGDTFSPTFPVTSNTMPPPAGVPNSAIPLVFLSKINTSNPTPLQYSTLLGGTGGSVAYGIAVDSTGDMYVTGETISGDFPVTQGALLETNTNPNGTGFVSKVNPGGNGSADLIYSTYFGGNGSGMGSDLGNGIVVSGTSAYVTGQTSSSNLPLSPMPAYPALKGPSDAFVAELPLIPTIGVSPTSIDFGTQLVGTPTTPPQIVTLTNNTSAPIMLTVPFTFTGANPADFPVNTPTTTCSTGSLAASGTCTIGLVFNPSTPLGESATLNVFDNADTSQHPIQVALTGTGSTSAGLITFTPPSLQPFGGQLLTTTSAPPQTVTISNPGTTTALNISAIAISSNFAIASNSCGNTFPIVIAPGGAACALNIIFAPAAGTAPGPVTGTLTVTDNANGSPQTLSLSGMAWDFSVSVAAITVVKGQTGSFPVVVTGSGGFTGPVSFTCTPGMLITSCSVPTINAGSPPTNGSITAASFIVPPESMKVPPSALLRQVIFIMLAMALLFMIPSVRRFRTRMGMAGAMWVFVLLAGCSGGPPAPQTSTITITPSSGGVTKPAITVTVTITR